MYKRNLSNPNTLYVLAFTWLLVFTFILPHQCRAQSISYIKRQIAFERNAHVKDAQQISVGAGRIQNGFNASLGYGKYVYKYLLIRTDFSFETAKYGNTTLMGYYLSPEANYTIKKFSNQFYLDAKAGFILADENLSNSIMVSKKLSNLVYGEKIGIKFEIFVSPTLSMNIDLEQRFLNNSQLGTLSRNVYISFSKNF